MFFMQSAHLHVEYYQIQMLVHRPFISPDKDSSIAFPSLAICVNAARSCSHIIERVKTHFPDALAPYLLVRQPPWIQAGHSSS